MILSRVHDILFGNRPKNLNHVHDHCRQSKADDAPTVERVSPQGSKNVLSDLRLNAPVGFLSCVQVKILT